MNFEIDFAIVDTESNETVSYITFEFDRTGNVESVTVNDTTYIHGDMIHLFIKAVGEGRLVRAVSYRLAMEESARAI
jgi:hypothetical protein